MSVIIEVPFTYHAMVKHSGDRNPKPRSIMDSMAVRLQEAAAGELAVAAAYRAGGQVQLEGARQRIDYLSGPQGLLRPMLGAERVDLAAVRELFSGWSAQASLEEPARYDFEAKRRLERLGPWPFDYCLPPSLRRIPVRATTIQALQGKVVSDNRLAMWDAVRDLMYRCMVVDGELHVPTRGPSWLVGPDGIAAVPDHACIRSHSHVSWSSTGTISALRTVQGTLEAVGHLSKSSSLTHAFRADRLGDALAFRHAVAGIPRPARLVHADTPPDGMLDVMDAAAIQAALDDTAYAAWDAAGFLEFKARERVGHMQDLGIRSFMHARRIQLADRPPFDAAREMDNLSVLEQAVEDDHYARGYHPSGLDDLPQVRTYATLFPGPDPDPEQGIPFGP